MIKASLRAGWLFSFIFLFYPLLSLSGLETLGPAADFLELCADAVANSPARRDIEDALLEAGRLERLSILSMLPVVSGGIGRDMAKGVGFDGRFVYQADLSLRQVLWDGGRWATARQAGRARIRRMATRLAAEERAAGLACMALVLETLRAGETLMLREKYHRYLSLERERLALRKELGSVLDSEYEEALIAIDEASLASERARAHLDECLAQLAILVGRPIERDLVLLPAGIDLDCVHVELPDDAAWQARDSAVLDALLYLEEAKTSFGLSSSNPVPLLHFEGGLQFSGESLPFTDISFSAGLSLSLAGPLVQTGAKAAWQRNRTGAEAIEQGVNLSTVPEPSLVLAQESAERMLSRARQGLERARAAACLSRQRACSQWVLAQRSSSVSLRRLAREEASQAEARLLLEQGHLSTGDWLSQELSLEEARIKALDARFDVLLAALELVPSLADIAGMLLFPDPKEET